MIINALQTYLQKVTKTGVVEISFFWGGSGAKKSVSTGLWERTSPFVFVLLLVVRVYMIMKKVFSVYMLLFMSISATVPYGLQ